MSDNPIVVNSVAEEYAYVSKQRCECSGTFAVTIQCFKSEPVEQDILIVKCRMCSEKRKIVFDINGFFNKQAEKILFKKTIKKKTKI